MKINKQVSIIYGDDSSITVNIFNNKILMELVGSFDNNLKELEKISGSKIYFRGNSIAIKRSEEHTSELQSLVNFVCRLLLENKKLNLIFT